MPNMSGVNAVASRVSSNVLKMNFMKKTAIKVEELEKSKRANAIKDEAFKSTARVYPTVQTIQDDPNCSIGSVFNEERMTVLEDFKFGRASFNGQNPEIEKHMIYHECKRLGLELPAEEEDGEIEANDESDSDMKNESVEEKKCVTYK